MDSHGGYWDYFSIFRKREEAWLKKQREVLGNNYWFQRDLRTNKKYQKDKTEQTKEHGLKSKQVMTFNKLSLKSHVFKKLNENIQEKEEEEYNKLRDINKL